MSADRRLVHVFFFFVFITVLCPSVIIVYTDLIVILSPSRLGVVLASGPSLSGHVGVTGSTLALSQRLIFFSILEYLKRRGFL